MGSAGHCQDTDRSCVFLQKLSIEKDTISQIETLEVEKDKTLAELSEIKVSKEEVEESQIETQGLVEDMENKHREEATELA